MNKVIYTIMATAIIACAIGIFNLPAEQVNDLPKTLPRSSWSYCMNSGKPLLLELTEIKYQNDFTAGGSQKLQFKGTILKNQFISKSVTKAKIGIFSGSPTTTQLNDDAKAGPFDSTTTEFKFPGGVRGELTMEIRY